MLFPFLPAAGKQAGQISIYDKSLAQSLFMRKIWPNLYSWYTSHLISINEEKISTDLHLWRRRNPNLNLLKNLTQYQIIEGEKSHLIFIYIKKSLTQCPLRKSHKIFISKQILIPTQCIKTISHNLHFSKEILEKISSDL